MAALETVLEQALQLTDDERGELIARLLQSLEPDDGEEVIGDGCCGLSSPRASSSARRGSRTRTSTT